MSGRRIAVGVSGAGLEPAGARRRGRRGELGGEIVLVFADRACPALDWAAEQGIETALVPGGDDATLAETLAGRRARRRRPGRLHADRRAARSSRRSPAGSSTPIRRCCRRSRARTPSRDALAARRRGHRRARSTSSTRRSTAARSSPRRRSPVLPGDDEATPARPDPGRRAPAAAAGGRAARWPARSRSPDGRRVTLDLEPRRRGASRARAGRCCRCRDKTGLVELGRGPRRPRLRARVDRRHGAGAARRRPAGHRRRRRDRLPGDARRPGQDAPPAGPRRASWPTGGSPTTARQLVAAGDRAVRARRRQPLPVRGGRRAARASPFDELVEEIDIGGPSMVRAAAKNHANVAIVTSPGALRRGPRRRSTRTAGVADSASGAALAVEAFRHTAAYDARIAAELPRRMAAAGVDLPDEPGLPGAERPVSADADDRAREGRDAALRREPAPAGGPLPAARARRRRTARSRPARRRSRARRCRTTTSSTRRRRRRSAGRCAARRASSSSTPTRAAPRSAPTLLEAWDGGARRRPGLGVRRRRRADPAGRRRGRRGARRRSSSRSSSRPAFDAGRARGPRREAEPARARRRPRSGRRRAAAPARARPDSARSGPPAAPSSSPRPTRSPTTRRPGPSRRSARPTRRGALDLDLAWRLVRGVTSNAIVLVRDGRLDRDRLGPDVAGSTPPARPSTKAQRHARRRRRSAAPSCASDAFYPVPRRGRGLPRRPA